MAWASLLSWRSLVVAGKEEELEPRDWVRADAAQVNDKKECAIKGVSIEGKRQAEYYRSTGNARLSRWLFTLLVPSDDGAA